MKYIETLREGEKIQEIYFCKSKSTAMTKTGKQYDSVILQDKTGAVDGKIWDPNSLGIDDFDAMDYIDIVAEVTVFNGTTQLNIKRVRKAHEGEYDEREYLPVSEKDIDTMYNELKTMIGTVKNSYLSKLLNKFFVEDEEMVKRIKGHSAAKSVHHSFVGGLLEHTLSVAKICDCFAGLYPVMNRDLLVSAAIFHDIGKINELSTFPINDYTDEGQLIGHIVTGTIMLDEKIKQIEGFPVKLGNELKHCILSHHGELEFGSPKKPALIEAVALSFADNTDAKLEGFIEVLDANHDKGEEWLGYSRMFDGNVRATSKQ